jgi:hypothetical protein
MQAMRSIECSTFSDPKDLLIPFVGTDLPKSRRQLQKCPVSGLAKSK